MNEPELREAENTGAMKQVASDPASRKRFLAMMGAGGAAAFSMFLAACGEDDDEGSTQGQKESGGANGDLGIVEYALTLEYLERDFYDAVIEAGVIKDRALADTAKSIRDNEQAHVDALTQTVKQLGGTPKRPRTNFDSVLEGGRRKVLQTAAEVENVGAAAYLGQAPRIKSKEILASALAIHTVEARHAAALNRVVGKSFVPQGAFAKPLPRDQVLQKVQPFIAG